MERKELHEIFNKYIKGDCSAEEIRELLLHFGLPEDQGLLKDLIFQQLENDDLPENVNAAHALQAFVKTDDALKAMFAQERHSRRKGRINRSLAIAAASLVVLFLGFLMRGYYVNYNHHQQESQVSDIEAGSNRALLKISGSNKQINLSKDKNGVVVKNGRFVYTDGSSISSRIFDKPDVRDNTPVLYTVETPRGGQYQIILADGSKVRLNAASSITYPMAFSGDSREVFITGEAFLEVAQDANKPFKVNAKNVSVLVTGTSFNMSAFDDDEKVITTLLTGGVKVTNGVDTAFLKPGQQAGTLRQAPEIKVSTVDVNQYTAWLREEFSLENKNIEEIMKEVARWYNVDVVYNGNKKDNRNFGGSFNRTKSLSIFLNHLTTLSGINFKLEGRRVTVTL